MQESPENAAHFSDEHWMREALAEADRAALHGDVPVGCVVLSAEGELLAREHNRREEGADPTAHAELLAVRLAAQRLGHWRLEGASVFVTLEPCPMCAGALVNSRIARLVYGARDPKAGAVESLFEIGRDLRLNHRFRVTPGVLADDCAARLKAFFAGLRAGGEPRAQGESSVGVSVPSSGAVERGAAGPESGT